MNDAITPAQCRAGRALLNWSREALAEASGVPSRTLADFELRNTKPRATTTRRLVEALQAAGVLLLTGDGAQGVGVRLRAPEQAPAPPEAS
ncbi:helix-turn-helix domain-containing protein [Teichococcus vastitatis]|uniref:Helix-turn-helix transcriptional regulator n=1 Tax=Teichococcus vastitatis TaxID=2307076 RepID=A0ABS9W2E0_9PROT|nr:helix-turn-helix transcriptional regulator [Pseudoroseomonas vastitatis]MCI0753462.1 helix-turn-helix transcriptional regulator [Pseudoroseomonas vastitatis]